MGFIERKFLLVNWQVENGKYTLSAVLYSAKVNVIFLYIYFLDNGIVL